jgi:hypothetical protein
MDSKLKNRLIFVCVPALILSLTLLGPYVIVNSEAWLFETHNSLIPTNYNNEKIDIYEFTGDAVPLLEDVNFYKNK